MAAALGKLAVKCGDACKAKSNRKRWGCDKDAADAGYSIRCWSCSGTGCDTCGGRGRVPLHACPSRIVSPDVVEMLRCYWWRRDGFLPVSGAMLDQTQHFLVAYDFLDGLRAGYESRDLDKIRKQAKAKAGRR